MLKKILTGIVAIFTVISMYSCGDTQTDSTNNSETIHSEKSDSLQEGFGEDNEEETIEKTESVEEFSPKDEIVNASANSGYIQVDDFVFRIGGYMTVNDFFEITGDTFIWDLSNKYSLDTKVEDYLGGNFVSYGITGMCMFYADGANAGNLTVYIADPEKEGATIGDAVVVQISGGKNVYHPTGLKQSLKGETRDIEDYYKFFEDAGLTKSEDEELSISYSTERDENKGKFIDRQNESTGNEEITGVVELEEENLFGVKPIVKYIGYIKPESETFLASDVYYGDAENIASYY